MQKSIQLIHSIDLRIVRNVTNDTVSWYNLLDISLPTHYESHKITVSLNPGAQL